MKSLIFIVVPLALLTLWYWPFRWLLTQVFDYSLPAWQYVCVVLVIALYLVWHDMRRRREHVA